MKKHGLFFGAAVMLTAAVFVLTLFTLAGCDNPASPPGPGGGGTS